MKISRVVSLSAMSTALAVICLVFGSAVDLFSLSCLFMASLALMLPLSKGYKLGGFLAYIASGVLTMIFIGVIPQVILPYAMFFGLHPLANYFQKQFKINVVIATVVKGIWFIGTLYVMYFATTMFVGVHPLIEKYIHYVLTIGGAIVFLVYDWLMVRFQKSINAIVYRLKL
jgi:hypothetical protein